MCNILMFAHGPTVPTYLPAYLRWIVRVKRFGHAQLGASFRDGRMTTRRAPRGGSRGRNGWCTHGYARLWGMGDDD